MSDAPKCHHDWQPLDPIRYEPREQTATVNGKRETVWITWVTDEVCALCGAESTWPT